MNDDFIERRDEIQKYFQFIESLSDGTHRVLLSTSNSEAYASSELTDIIKTFKANAFLLLYNLVESTVKNGVEAIFDELQAKSIDFDSCREELRKIVLHGLRKRNVDKVVPQIAAIAKDVIGIAFRKDELFAGNVDARAIRKTAQIYGFISPKKKSDQLVIVKDNRNDLAHGNKSFGEVGRDYSMLRLEEIRKEVFAYLEELNANVETYISEQRYLHSKAVAL